MFPLLCLTCMLSVAICFRHKHYLILCPTRLGMLSHGMPWSRPFHFTHFPLKHCTWLPKCIKLRFLLILQLGYLFYPKLDKLMNYFRGRLFTHTISRNSFVIVSFTELHFWICMLSVINYLMPEKYSMPSIRKMRYVRVLWLEVMYFMIASKMHWLFMMTWYVYMAWTPQW